MKRLWLLSILFLAPSVSSCGCTLFIIDQNLEPSFLTLTVGETALPPRASVSGCNMPRRSVEIDSWESENPNIASVTPDTGVTTGVAPGKTNIMARKSGFFSNLPVTVLAP